VEAEGLPYWSVVTADLPQKGGSIKDLSLVPKNPRVIRYVTFAIVPRSTKLPEKAVGTLNLPANALLGTWAPGYNGVAYPTSMSRKYAPNSKLVAMVHYRPTGKPEDASFKVEIYNSFVAPTNEPIWITLEKKDIEIPAGKSIVTELTYPVTKDIKVISLLPEGRFYAARIQLQYTPKTGTTKTLFDNMRWDPYWVGNYMFDKPISLAKGGTLTAKFFYDNDEFCRINEGKKPKPVKAGPLASDEVCRMHILLAP
jgi:hypothetical protein